ncbi:MAG: TonB-dependent receptor [Crocinitomicaceae bacterium]|nr:TonB-dependent receptor [Crocinitomicaceae bacterium]
MTIVPQRYVNCSLILLLLISSIFSSNSLYAQDEDSLSIQLFGYDDLNLDNGNKKRIITSTNRMAESPEDMAQEVIIIDGDEIRKYGYSTLVDVLKSIPGFRTSQPGNAMEGETFLMRGIYGNDYVKILVNGIPVKPEAVRGMPIASQLPIRHAERIEIMLGPSSASYGTDAIGGVINIVLPEIDRPVFAWADVNLLTPGASEFNLTLGGKIGKGKNILNYELFATSHRASDVNLNIPEDSIRVDGNTLESPQFQSLYIGESDVPEIDDLKRESRLLGAYLKFRWFELSAMNMFREEHSGFGSDPLASSYHNPGLTFGENINSFSLKYHDEKKKRYMSQFSISALMYRTLTNSSYYGVNNALSNGMNFMYARSLDFNAEYSGVLKINANWKLALGATGDYSISHPFTNYLWRPYRSEESSFNVPTQSQELETAIYQNILNDTVSKIDSLVPLERYTRYNFGGFAHVSYKSDNGKWNGELGVRVDYNSFGHTVFTPKLGLVYRPTPRLKIRAYFGTGYRAPRSYYLYNNYNEYFLKHKQGEGLKRERVELDSEVLYGGEIGIEWRVVDPLKFTLKYYTHTMDNKIMRQEYLPPPIEDSISIKPEDEIGYGYYSEDANSTLHSIMFNTEFKKEYKNWDIDILLSYQYSIGSESAVGDENAPQELTESVGYRFVPKHMVKANFNVSFFDFTISLRNTILGDYITEVYRINDHIQHEEIEQYFYNLDIILHKQLFRQLSIFGGVYNVTDNFQSGISNVNVSNTWGINPQYGRTYKLGLTFKLN